MASLNQVALIGNIGNDPEIKNIPNGRVASFSLATTEKWKDKSNGEERERTEWHKIVTFNEAQINFIEKYLGKGRSVFVQGSIQYKKWTDKDGNERTSTEIILGNFGSKLLALDRAPEVVVSKKSKSRSISKDPDDEIPF